MASFSRVLSVVRVTPWERVSPWRRLLCAFGRVALLVVIVVFLIDLLAPPLTIVMMRRIAAKDTPGVNVTPLPLRDCSTSMVPGKTLSYFGYQFEVPWTSDSKQTSFDKRGLVQLQFDSGQNITFTVPTNQHGILSEIAQERTLGDGMPILFGDLMNRSAYDQYAAVLNVTPASVKAFGPRQAASRAVWLLVIKSIAMSPALKTGAFSFQFPDKRGFQVGDPAQSKRIDLEVFGMGGYEVEIICTAAKGTARLTQPEINRILASLHPVTVGSGPTHNGKTESPQR